MAKLKAVYDKEEDIPVEYKALFKQKDEKWAIEIEGIQTDANVARLEFSIKKERDENAKLREEAKLHGKTPEEVVALAEELESVKAQLEAGGGKPDQEATAKLVDAQLKIKVGPLERSILKLTKERDEAVGATHTLTGEITTGKIELALRAAAEKAKVVPSAIPDVVMRGLRDFELIEHEGKIRIVTKEGHATPGIEPEVWVEDLSQIAPHYWPGNQGAGANGSGIQLGITENNPWTKGHWNATEKGKIIEKYGNEKAGQLAKAAGSTLYALEPPKA